MGEETAGSSNAARSAPPDEKTAESGLFGRLVGAFRGVDPVDAEEAPPGGAGQAGVSQKPGLGSLDLLRVEDVAIPKVEIVAVPADIALDDLVGTFRDTAMSRLPVYDGTLDSPLGLVHLKDLALGHGFNGNSPDYDLKALLRPLLFVPPSMPVSVLLQKMQTARRHMALVIDEYGGVDGLVTIEDLIEQVVGEIEDEHDIAEGRPWTQEKPGCYLAQARAPLDDFEEEIGFRLLDDETEEEADTLGGLVFVLTGRVPARGEVVEHDSGTAFEVVDADPRRIKRLRVRLPEKLS